MRHHTKDKGDSGVGFVVADLIASGLQVALPLSEHTPFDLIAIHPTTYEVRRVSVKFRSVNGHGRVEVRYRSAWADRNGTQFRHHEAGEYDATAVYCPETGECYYVRYDEAADRSFALRIAEPKNGQTEGVRFARDFAGAERLFAA